MAATLVAVDQQSDIPLDKPILIVGRNDQCDIIVDSKKVSRMHCCIARLDDHLIVRDLASTNGVQVNGERVNEGMLCEGDELTIGNMRYRVAFQASSIENMKTNPAKKRPPVSDSLIEASDVPIPIAESLMGGPTDDDQDEPDSKGPAIQQLFASTDDDDDDDDSNWLSIPENIKLSPDSESET